MCSELPYGSDSRDTRGGDESPGSSTEPPPSRRHQQMLSVSLGALQVEQSTHLFAVCHRKLPEFRVVIGVDEVEDNMLHVALLRTQKVGGFKEVEGDGLAVRRNCAHHARLISCVAIVSHQQA